MFKKLHREALQIFDSCTNLDIDPDHCYNCRKCDRTFQSKDQIRRHESSCSSKKDKEFYCPKCGKLFLEKNNMILHETCCSGFAQNPEKPFSCFHCGKGFTRKDKRKVHEKGCNRQKGNETETGQTCYQNTLSEVDSDNKSMSDNKLNGRVKLEIENPDKKELMKGNIELLLEIQQFNENDGDEIVKKHNKNNDIKTDVSFICRRSDRTSKRKEKLNLFIPTSLDKPSSALPVEPKATTESTNDEDKTSNFQPSVVSTPCRKRKCLEQNDDQNNDMDNMSVVETGSDEHCEIVELEKTGDNCFDLDEADTDTADYCDIDQLLDSDDETEPVKEGPDTFVKDDIVWEMWYRNAVSKGRVKDVDLNTSPPLVIAQLCVVTSVKRVRGKVEVVGLLAVPVDGSVLDMKLSGHTNSIKFVRKFGTLVENNLVVDSQRYRNDFHTVVEQVDSAERYLTNHVGLDTISSEEVRSFREFLAMESFDRCIYLEGLRRLKKGLSKEIPHRGESFERSLEREGIYDHVNKKELVNEVFAEELAVKKKPVPVDNNDSYLETLDKEMKDLVSCLSDKWPLEWMKHKSEIAKLKRIMTRKKNCRRHELFMDSRQRNFRINLPELIKTSNSSFMNIFGKKREIIDRDVRIFLIENVFNKTKRSKDFDSRLTKLLAQSLVSWRFIAGLELAVAGAGNLTLSLI